MAQSKYERLLEIKDDTDVTFRQGDASFALCPDLGGRVFMEIAGRCPYRIDFDSISQPTDDFNNYGGGNFWPAPEGGKFGFNYEGDEWVVQHAINRQPFEVQSKTECSALISKKSVLTNRLGTKFTARVSRTFSLCEPLADVAALAPKAIAAYESVDEFEVMDKVTTEQALIASWTLEQFDATPTTIAFCAVENPKDAINFDFYEHPGERIEYFKKGFTYRTDGKKAGQIGVKVSSCPRLLGFYDTETGFMCVRENMNIGGGVYFNIADNDQADGPYSAADCYSIFNSDPDMAAFELETIGSARILGDILIGSRLVSRTTFAAFEDSGKMTKFVDGLIN